MKSLLIIVAVLLLLATFKLPIGYFTFLRIAVSLTSIIVISREIKDGITIWVIILGLIASIFNPIIPIYIGSKDTWIPIDIICAIIFISKSFNLKSTNNEK